MHIARMKIAPELSGNLRQEGWSLDSPQFLGLTVLMYGSRNAPYTVRAPDVSHTQTTNDTVRQNSTSIYQ